MTPGEIVLTLFIVLASAGSGTLFWRQIESLRGEMVTLRAELKGDMDALRAELKGEMVGLRTEVREEIAELRREMRAEFASLRSDLTQVALAVGAVRPRASDA